jgi:uncharacterized protein
MVETRLNLDDLSIRAGRRHVYTYPADIAPVVMGGVEYEVTVPSGVEVGVDRVAGGYLVHVNVAAVISGPCMRCLEATAPKLTAEEEEFVPTATGEWIESESSPFIEGMIVDVNALGREALVLAMPDQVLCSADCRGLCPQCGADLNKGPCPCEPLEISGPMG